MSSTAKEYLETASYAIVAFDEYDDCNKKLIDIVPRSWVTVDENDDCFCKYPPLEMAAIYLTKWLKELKQPDESWTTHSVDIISRAGKYS